MFHPLPSIEAELFAFLLLARGVDSFRGTPLLFFLAFGTVRDDFRVVWVCWDLFHGASSCPLMLLLQKGTQREHVPLEF